LTKFVSFDDKYCINKYNFLIVECGDKNIIGEEIAFNKNELYDYTLSVNGSNRVGVF